MRQTPCWCDEQIAIAVDALRSRQIVIIQSHPVLTLLLSQEGNRYCVVTHEPGDHKLEYAFARYIFIGVQLLELCCYQFQKAATLIGSSNLEDSTPWTAKQFIKLVGIDHVGLGSDFDGVGESLPPRLKDVSDYPQLIETLLERGYTEEQITKVSSGNVFRVWSAVEGYSNASIGGQLHTRLRSP